jgi:hypothetical protein
MNCGIWMFFNMRACMQAPAPPPPPVTGCTALGMAPDSISCQDVSLILLYIVLLPVLALCIRYKTLHARGEPLTFRNLLGMAAASQRSNMWAEELAEAAEADREVEEEPPKSLRIGLQYSSVEEWLRSWYFEQVLAHPFSFYMSLFVSSCLTIMPAFLSERLL